MINLQICLIEFYLLQRHYQQDIFLNNTVPLWYSWRVEIFTHKNAARIRHGRLLKFSLTMFSRIT